MSCFKCRTSVWLAALGLVLALAGLLVATGESIRHGERAWPLSGSAGLGKSMNDARSDGVYHPPGSSVWMTP
jgi:hypothetical protein